MQAMSTPLVNLILLYFIYGLSFFLLGCITLVLSTKVIRYPIERNFWWLGAFGIVHGIHEWLDMLLLLGKHGWPTTILLQLSNLQLITLAASFLFLLGFGLKSLSVPNEKYQKIVNYIILGLFILIVAAIINCFLFHAAHSTHAKNMGIIFRYFLCFPASILTTIAMFRYFVVTKCDKNCPKAINVSAIVVAFTFFVYAIVAGIIVPQSNFWPASIINMNSFYSVVGINVLFFRTFCAIIMVLSVYQVLIACNYCMVKQLKEERDLDPLTKLQNRHSFDEKLTTHCAYATRYHRPLSILFIDIDHFKHYNDTYGHTEGDKVLQQIAKLFMKQVRNLDLIFRFGGEEFVIILPETSAVVAKKTALRLKKVIQNCTFKPKSRPVHKTVSIGIAQLTPSITPKKLVDFADEAMYKAKQEGRNTICIHGQKKCYS